MVIKTASPGVFIKEVDLTRGTADAITQNVGFVAGPFEKGPVDQITLVTQEVEFKRIFGGPTDENYEYWHTINNFLEYSGTCYVVRCDDADGDTVDAAGGLGLHPQKMRNSTSKYDYYPNPDTPGNPINPLDPEQEQNAQSTHYIRNSDEFYTQLNGHLPNAGCFLGNNPGRWTNGIGVAVIDSGADFQLTLKTDDLVFAPGNLIHVDGGDADTSIPSTDNIDGGGNAATDNNTLVSARPRGIFTDLNEAGEKLVRYAKLVSTEDLKLEKIKELDVVDGGSGFFTVTSEGVVNLTGDIKGVPTTTDGGGEGLVLDIETRNGIVISATVNYDGAKSPTGYAVGDTITTNNGHAGEEAVFTIDSVFPASDAVISVGGVRAAIIREESSGRDNTKVDYYVVAVAPQKDGTFPDTPMSGSNISDIDGNTVGELQALYPLGDYVYYNKGGNQIVNVIWEPIRYTRSQGMEWYWPNRPVDGEKVFNGKIAVNAAGNPILGQDGESLFVEGPASVTSPIGNTISWNARREVWEHQYVPQEGDIVFDPKSDGIESFLVLRSNDWYSQQVAFEGLPWRQFAGRPGTSANAQDLGAENDELNIIIYDAMGDVTGRKGQTIEQYHGVSKLKGAVTIEGSNNYYRDLINNDSAVLYANDQLEIIGDTTDSGINKGKRHPGTQIASDVVCAYLKPKYGSVDLLNIADIPTQPQGYPYLLLGGEDQLSASLGEVQAAYYKAVEENIDDLDYIIQGPAYDTTTIGQLNNTTDYHQKLASAVGKSNFLIALGEELKTAMVLISPPRCASLDPINAGEITQKSIEWAEQLSSSSYAVLDSGYKYMYDRFSDKYRYVPLNSDIAGVMAQTALFSEPFFSPAGMSRGQIRNVVKLGYDPSKSHRDLLFTSRINPVVTFPGEGTVLYGDKTALSYNSAFSRINVRRLFIYLERQIAKIAKQVLFEFNDVPTRTNFKNNVNPFMRDVQSKRGMIDFLVVCDDSNNTPEVVDRNEFVADLYIKPNRSINFVQLNFIATKTGISFSEAVGLNRRVEGLQ